MKRILLATAIALATISTAASAAQVRPLYSEYAPTKKAGVLSVVNMDKVPKTYQAFAFEWVAENGKAVKKPTTALRFGPTVFTIQPGKTQTVRWVHTGKKPGEQAYRILVQEVPDKVLEQMPGVINLLHADFPWFWRPEGLAPVLTARWDGGVLVVKNDGNATAQLSDLVAGSVSQKGLIGYVIPGEEARFDVGGKAKVAVSISVNGKGTTLEAK